MLPTIYHYQSDLRYIGKSTNSIAITSGRVKANLSNGYYNILDNFILRQLLRLRYISTSSLTKMCKISVYRDHMLNSRIESNMDRLIKSGAVECYYFGAGNTALCSYYALTEEAISVLHKKYKRAPAVEYTAHEMCQALALSQFAACLPQAESAITHYDEGIMFCTAKVYGKDAYIHVFREGDSDLYRSMLYILRKLNGRLNKRIAIAVCETTEHMRIVSDSICSKIGLNSLNGIYYTYDAACKYASRPQLYYIYHDSENTALLKLANLSV